MPPKKDKDPPSLEKILGKRAYKKYMEEEKKDKMISFLNNSLDDNPVKSVAVKPVVVKVKEPVVSRLNVSKPVVAKRLNVSKPVVATTKHKQKKKDKVQPFPEYNSVDIDDREYKKPVPKVRIWEESRHKDPGPNATHQTDLIEFSSKQVVNRPKLKGKRAVVITDIKTKKTDVRWIENKTAKEVRDKTKDIYENGDLLDPPKFRMMSDQGNEFRGEYADYVKNELKVKQVMKPGERHTLGKVDHKIGVLKEKFFDKYDEAKVEKKPIDVNDMLEETVNEYNKTVRKKGFSTYNDKFPPLEQDVRVSAKLETDKNEQYNKTEQVIHKVGDVVKLKIYDSKIKKGEPKWSNEDYIITNVLMNPDSPPRYILDKYDVNSKTASGKPDNQNPVHYKHVRLFDEFKVKRKRK